MTALVLSQKAPDDARHDAHVGLGIAFLTFVVGLGAVIVVLRRAKRQVDLEHAERVLREEIDSLHQEWP